MHLTVVLLTRLQNHKHLRGQHSRWYSLVSGGLVMRTHDGYEAQDSYDRAQDSMGENVRVGNDDIESNGRRFQETPSDVATTMRSLIKS